MRLKDMGSTCWLGNKLVLAQNTSQHQFSYINQLTQVRSKLSAPTIRHISTSVNEQQTSVEHLCQAQSSNDRSRPGCQDPILFPQLGSRVNPAVNPLCPTLAQYHSFLQHGQNSIYRMRMRELAVERREPKGKHSAQLH